MEKTKKQRGQRLKRIAQTVELQTCPEDLPAVGETLASTALGSLGHRVLYNSCKAEAALFQVQCVELGI